MVAGLFGIFCLDHATQSAPGRKLTRDFGPSRSARSNYVVENAVDGIFVENTDVSVCVYIHFERLKFKAMFIRLIVKSNRPKVRQIGFGTDSRILWNHNRNFVAFVLVWKGLNVG